MVITADVSGTAGTTHMFMCNITTAAAVDTSVTAELTWSGPGVGSGRHSITPVMAVDGSNMFTSTLELSPLTSSDAGLYICSVTLSPAGDTTFINPSAAGNDSQSLDVAGKHLPFHVCFSNIVQGLGIRTYITFGPEYYTCCVG